MSITRAPLKKDQPFTFFSNELLRDAALSAESLGVLVYLLSRPPDWVVQLMEIRRHFNFGRDKMRNIMNVLIEAGYVTRLQEHGTDGEFEKQKWLISNEKSPLTENPATDYPATVKQPLQRKEEIQKKDIRPAKQQDGTYPEEFEADWKLAAELGAPRTRNTSKKKTYDHWRMLNAENMARMRAAIPIFAAAMRAEGRPDDKIKHFEFFLSQQIYETVSASTPAAKQAAADWYKTATRDQWERALVVWRRDSNWRGAWGPAPGRPGCAVPDDLLTEHEKWVISKDGKQAVDSRLPA